MPPGTHDSSDTASACSPGRGGEAMGPSGKEEVVLRPPETTASTETRPEKDYDSSATVRLNFLYFDFLYLFWGFVVRGIGCRFF